MSNDSSQSGSSKLTIPTFVTETRGAADFLRLILERRYFGEETRLDVAPAADGNPEVPFFYEVQSYVEVESERVRELTTNLLASLHAAGVRARIWIRREPDGMFKIWYGAERPRADGGGKAHDGRLLQRLMEGNFVGMELASVGATAAAQARDEFGRWESPAVGFIVGIPSEREDTEVETRLDEAFEALASTEFELVLRCDPVLTATLDQHIDRLGWVVEQATALARQTHSKSEGENYGKSLSMALGTSEGTGTNWSEGTSETENRGGGGPWGAIIGSAAGFIGGMFAGPAAAVVAPIAGGLGAKIGQAIGSLIAPGGSTGTSSSKGGSETSGTSWQETDTENWGKSVQSQVSFENLNYAAEQLEENVRAHMERLRTARSLGGWRVSIGLVAKDDEGLELAAHALIGALRGDQSWLETPRLVRVAASAKTHAITHIRRFDEVILPGNEHPLIPGGEHPSTVLSSLELSHWLRPPARELPGIRMNRPVHFARALAPASDDPVSLGRLEFWGRVSRSEVRLPLREFSQHTLVAGTTGAGKTSTVKQILYQLQQRPQPIPFLVLEPAKDEYLDLFETLRREGKNPLRLTVGGRPSDDGCEGPLRFNPLAIPNGLVAGQHVEQIKILLRASFSMQESLPQILEAVIAETYAEKRFGIDSVAMGKPYTGELPLPTLRDLVTRTDDSTTAIVINKVVTRLGYEDRIAQNLIAAIRVRLESFGIGLKRDLFMGGDMDFGDALSRPTFINISGLPEPDVRRFLAASLFVRLYGERIAEKARRAGVAAADGPGIRHMLVLEEAHHFMRRAVGHGPSVELMRETNAILANAFAELRSFGQAILVADQGPGELDEAVLRNTNTKICHRLFYEADCVAMADSMGLDEEQRGALRRLLPGHAAVFSPSLRQAVATRVTEWKASSLWGPASAPR